MFTRKMMILLVFLLVLGLYETSSSSSSEAAVTISSCSSYLCPLYKQEMIAYFSKGITIYYCYYYHHHYHHHYHYQGCVGNFSDVVTEYSQLKDGYVSMGVVIFLGGCSFLFALAAGKNKTSSSLSSSLSSSASSLSSLSSSLSLSI